MLFDVMGYLLISWRTSVLFDKLFNSMMYFWTSWRTFWHHDVNFNIWNTFRHQDTFDVDILLDFMTYPLAPWHIFIVCDVMTYFDIMTCFQTLWHYDVSFWHYGLFDVKSYTTMIKPYSRNMQQFIITNIIDFYRFYHNAPFHVLFDVMTYYWRKDIILKSFFDIMA